MTAHRDYECEVCGTDVCEQEDVREEALEARSVEWALARQAARLDSVTLNSAHLLFAYTGGYRGVA